MEATLEKTKSGDYTLKVNSIYIHSSYNPIRESQKSVEYFVQNNKTPNYIIVLGLGLGYHVVEICKRYPHSTILVAEKHARFTDMMTRNNINISIFKRNVHIFYTADKFFDHLLNKASENDVKDLAIYEHKPSISLSPNFYSEIGKSISTAIKSKLRNIVTDLYFGRKWHNNILSNSQLLNKAISLSNYYKAYNCPVIVTASGPSLDKSIPTIKKLCDKVLIISPVQSLNILLYNEIVPDIIVSIDGGYYNRAYFNYINNNVLKHSLWIFSLCVQNQKKVALNSSLTYINSGLPLEQKLLQAVEKVPPILMEGSVTFSCIRLAQYITKGTIILSGFDLAFTKKRTHFKGSVNEEKLLYKTWQNKTIDNFNTNLIYTDPIEVKGNTTNVVISSQALTSYLSWANESLHKLEQPICNCTEGGAEIKGIPYIALSEIDKQFTSKTTKKIKVGVDNKLKIDNVQLKDIFTELYDAYSILKSQLKNNFSLELLQNNVNNSKTWVKKSINLHLGRFFLELEKNNNKMLIKDTMEMEINKTLKLVRQKHLNL